MRSFVLYIAKNSFAKQVLLQCLGSVLPAVSLVPSFCVSFYCFFSGFPSFSINFVVFYFWCSPEHWNRILQILIQKCRENQYLAHWCHILAIICDENGKFSYISVSIYSKNYWRFKNNDYKYYTIRTQTVLWLRELVFLHYKHISLIFLSLWHKYECTLVICLRQSYINVIWFGHTFWLISAMYKNL